MPSELMKKLIKPLEGAPPSPPPAPSPNQLDLSAMTATENELIANKLESMGGKKDPDRHWAKVNKYTCYAVVGFGTLNPAIGRGVYGMELQKALRRQVNSYKRTLWGLEIRAPIANRVDSGTALVRWGGLKTARQVCVEKSR